VVSARKWARSEVIAIVALVVAGASVLMDLHTRYLWKPRPQHNLVASVFNFEYVRDPSTPLLRVDIAIQNMGNMPEIVRQIRFVLPFPAGVFMQGRGRAVPAHARISLDARTGVGTVWPDSNVIALANIELGPGEIELRQLRQPITEDAILRFLRDNEEMLPGDRQLVGLEFVSLSPTGEPVSKIASVATVDREGSWYSADWVPVDLLAGTQKFHVGTQGFLEVKTDDGSIE
jgi:hypothetical protein